MQQPPVLVKSISQKDNHTFNIVWSDDLSTDFRLDALQRQCPCAKCTEEKKDDTLNSDVRAVRITSVGRYALKVKFTSGCSNGIYSFAMLRDLFTKGKNV